ncbi:MAG: F0F1 ATP synthase subunit A [Peptostreptococcaceae bacterium]|nr:F0F1 ATP synthase subunit A [Peptostreptococcaceae bacterium]
MEFGAKVVYTFSEDIPLIGGFRLTETLVVMWGISLFLIISAYLLTRNFQKVPKGVQNAVEVLVGAIYNLTASTMGEDKIGFAPYIGTIILFIAFSNLSGLFALRPPTADLNTTLSLSLMTFFLIHGSGIRKKGLGKYLKGFSEPFVLLTPINVIGELATPISLSFRLFGNLVGGLIIMSLVYIALGNLSAMIGINIPILQIGIPVILHGYFDLFSGLLQTFIFTMLSMIFISGAMD